MRERIGIAMGVLIVSVMCLTACGSDGEVRQDDMPNTNLDHSSKIAVNGEEDIFLYEIVLSDGTHCAIMDGYRSGSIDCDWK